MGRKTKVIDDGAPTITQDPMTHNVQKKRPYTDQEIMNYSHNMAEAIAIISDKEQELKDFAAGIKDEIAGQEDLLRDCAARVNAGYEMISVECKVTYDKNIVIYTDKRTGEIVEKRELTEEEQTSLSDKWVDAEQVIRQDGEKEE